MINDVVTDANYIMQFQNNESLGERGSYPMFVVPQSRAEPPALQISVLGVVWFITTFLVVTQYIFLAKTTHNHPILALICLLLVQIYKIAVVIEVWQINCAGFKDYGCSANTAIVVGIIDFLYSALSILAALSNETPEYLPLTIVKTIESFFFIAILLFGCTFETLCTDCPLTKPRLNQNYIVPLTPYNTSKPEEQVVQPQYTLVPINSNA